jgi:cytochrome c oxidase subunit 2
MQSGYSNIAPSVDSAFLLIIGISIALLLAVTAAMVYFAVHFSRKNHPDAREVGGNLWLEIVWTVVPTVLVMGMFWAGYTGFKLMRTVPEGARVVKVTGRMWSWLFEYENGKSAPELVVEKGEPVRLALTSLDVIHSLFIPAFRVKEDAVPGQETVLWFIPEAEGEFDLFCTEYCGLGHSGMITKVRVLGRDEYDKWLQEGAGGAAHSPAAQGQALLDASGCLGCHSLDGTPLVGPTLKGLWGRTVELESGATLTADEAYVERSLREPGADVVKGYPPVMPPFALGSDEVDALVAYLKGLQ